VINLFLGCSDSSSITEGLGIVRIARQSTQAPMEHWHPTDERIVVLQGTFEMGLGERFDTAAGRELPVGSYAVTPKAVRHFVWAKGETVIQVSGTGPFGINYVNPADDPRKASKK